MSTTVADPHNSRNGNVEETTEHVQGKAGTRRDGEDIASTAAPAASAAAALAKSHSPPEDVSTSPSATASVNATTRTSPANKRRKVNLGQLLIKTVLGTACVYCRRSHMTCDLERPCTRCLKRNIGHLCHDEPREHSKPVKSDPGLRATDESGPVPGQSWTATGDARPNVLQPRLTSVPMQEAAGALGPPSVARNDATTSSAQIGPTMSIAATQTPAIAPENERFLAYPDWSMTSQNPFHDMHTLHPSYMFNAPEVTNEYNLLNDFLSSSLLDEGVLFGNEDAQNYYADPSRVPANVPNAPLNEAPIAPSPALSTRQIGPSTLAPGVHGTMISRPPSAARDDKARETYYMTAADPSGSDPPEERMNKLLKAKYDAGLLKPFNYVKGYARLSQYMERNLQPASRQKILRQLDQFRPKFRERMQKLTDIELVLVEMWFERSLMEYDRVFASMAIPACCWRRTGEIFRGNKEMAELIHVPIERLRDGKIAIHEIFENDSIVSYWEKFGTIAFDNAQKAMLTSCHLKNPEPKSKDPTIHCCFSFTIRRDTHNIPSIIVGNFLPMDPPKR